MLILKNLKVNDVLDDISLTFEKGKTYVIVGSNGVGKSTLLHSIMGRPDLEVSGDIIFDSQQLTDMEVHERAKAGLFLGFQSPTAIPGLSNFQLIKQATDSNGKEIVQRLKHFKEMSEELGLPDQWDRKSVNDQASGGEKKKNELIQMSMLNVTCAMLDEPDSGLDIDGIESLVKFLNDWRNENNTLIVVSHYERLISALNPDVIINLKKDGATVGDITLAEKIFNTGFKNV